jgi:endonuclease/exonuclease/phosphatase family metal-dependent hydrolase
MPAGVRISARFAATCAALASLSLSLSSALAQQAGSPKPTEKTQPAQDAPKPSAEVEKYLKEASEGVIRHGVKTPKPRAPGTIRLATYNIENLFDVEKASEDAGRSPTPRKPDEHRKAIAAAIKAIDADVLALQEIESKEVLAKFRDDYLKDMGYEYISSLDAGDGRGIEQSVLSRFPIAKDQNWPDTTLDAQHPAKLGKRDNPDAGKPIKMARSPLHAVVQVPTEKSGGDKPYTLHLFVVHHKSGAFHSYQREAETFKVSKMLEQMTIDEPNANVVVLGDFNAKPDEKATQNYFNVGMIDPFAGVDPRDPTFMTHVSGRAIDHMLFNSNAAREIVKDSRFVLGTIQRKENVDWRTTAAPAGYGSDHYPVVVDIYPQDK